MITKSTAPTSSRRSFLLTSAAVLLMPSQGMTAPKGYGIVGQQAPDLEIEQWIDGSGAASSFDLADHKGKFVFLELWQAWCPGCHSHGFPGLQKIVKAFQGSEYFTPVAIQTTFEGYAYNTAEKMREMQLRYDLPIMMGHDEGDASAHKQPNTMRSYRTGGTPWAILIAPDGTVIFNDFSINADSAIAYLQTEIDKLMAEPKA